ncbi:hypothetical protein BaRGS_00008836 [Batillaria attramentaria]|uniref:Mutator-like transposase domain-containing protein n=1 Tax=Batillaria attramentaria TaxID=370345 RepID=A0ABD0LKP1_9CAEN
MAEETDDNVRNIDASGDGTWVTRGHTSAVGVARTIGCVSGNVLDTGVKSTVCKSCDAWKKRDHNTASYRRWEASHAPHCTLSHEGSSRIMHIIRHIWYNEVNKDYL